MKLQSCSEVNAYLASFQADDHCHAAAQMETLPAVEPRGQRRDKFSTES